MDEGLSNSKEKELLIFFVKNSKNENSHAVDWKSPIFPVLNSAILFVPLDPLTYQGKNINKIIIRYLIQDFVFMILSP